MLLHEQIGTNARVFIDSIAFRNVKFCRLNLNSQICDIAPYILVNFYFEEKYERKGISHAERTSACVRI